MVSVPTAENPATPSKAADVVAAAAVLLPVPLQSPEIVIVFDAPLATNDVKAVLTGKEKVEVMGRDGALLPPPPPQPERLTSSKV